MSKPTEPHSHADAKAQAKKFRDLARQLECDEDEKAFEEKVRKVAKAAPPTDQKRD